MPTLNNRKRKKKKNRSKGWTKAGNAKYNNRQWRTLRKYKLSLNPLCEHCEKKGIFREAKIVDHIKQVEKGGEMFALENLQSLCVKCHNSKSGKESHDNS